MNLLLSSIPRELEGANVFAEQDWITAPPIELSSPDALFRGGPDALSVLDFWQWGFSDLRMNIVRGVLAEFLVARAVGDPADKLRDPWRNYDVITPEGIQIEVKSSAYLQAWPMRKLSKPSFGKLIGRKWDPIDGWSSNPEIRADVFVFCLHTAKRHDDYDPLDVQQWDFWVVGASKVRARGAKGVALQFVKDHSEIYKWADLKTAVERAFANEPKS